MAPGRCVHAVLGLAAPSTPVPLHVLLHTKRVSQAKQRKHNSPKKNTTLRLFTIHICINTRCLATLCDTYITTCPSSLIHPHDTTAEWTSHYSNSAQLCRAVKGQRSQAKQLKTTYNKPRFPLRLELALGWGDHVRNHTECFVLIGRGGALLEDMNTVALGCSHGIVV